MESTLIQIIRIYEDFKKSSNSTSGQDNLAQFVSFMNDQVHTISDYSEEVNNENWKKFNRKTLLEMATAYIGKMGRYLDNYGRKNIPLTPLGSIDEFTYLIVLLEHDELSKSDLIHRNGHAITTGTDIIKRLINKDFVNEKPNPNDRRSIKLQISENGKKALFESSSALNKLSVIGAGILSNEELIKLVGMLQKLDHFHDMVHKNNKDLVSDAILDQYKEQLHM